MLSAAVFPSGGSTSCEGGNLKRSGQDELEFSMSSALYDLVAALFRMVKAVNLGLIKSKTLTISIEQSRYRPRLMPRVLSTLSITGENQDS